MDPEPSPIKGLMGHKNKNDSKKNNSRQGKMVYYQVVDYFRKMAHQRRRGLTKENIEV